MSWNRAKGTWQLVDSGFKVAIRIRVAIQEFVCALWQARREFLNLQPH
jgi:hypothetical protein